MVTSAIEVSKTAPTVLTYRLQNSEPVDLLDLTGSLTAIGEQFRKFMRQRGTDIAAEEVRLFIREVRDGSVVADLIAMAKQYSLLPPDMAWIIQFAQELASFYGFFKGDTDSIDTAAALDKGDYDRLAQIIEPVAKDSGAQLNIVASAGATVIVNLGIGSMEANAAQNRIRRYRDMMPETLTGIHHDQVFYWYQVRDDTAAKPGDKGVIPRLSERAVKVQFASDGIKAGMIDRPENPFRLYYIVDVDVTEIDGKPVLYRVLDLKGTTERD